MHYFGLGYMLTDDNKSPSLRDRAKKIHLQNTKALPTVYDQVTKRECKHNKLLSQQNN